MVIPIYEKEYDERIFSEGNIIVTIAKMRNTKRYRVIVENTDTDEVFIAGTYAKLATARDLAELELRGGV